MKFIICEGYDMGEMDGRCSDAGSDKAIVLW